MKKSIQSLVLLLMTLMVPMTAVAVTDGVNYESVNGIKIVNQWIQDRVHTPETWANMPYCNMYARTAVMYDGYIYIARSNAKTVIQGTDTLVQSIIYKVDATNGHLVKELPLTLNGTIYGGAILSSNTVGVDSFGHLYMAPFSGDLDATQLVYMVDKETGVLSLMGELEKGDVLLRCEHIDVIGDITRQEAECNIMSAGVRSEYIYRWHADKRGEWGGGFYGVPYLAIHDFYPETLTNWGYAPIVKMKLGEEERKRYSGKTFYIDGFTSAPILYDVSGTMVDNFENVDSDLWPMDLGANGLCEFTLDGRNFIVYVVAQYTGMDEATGVPKACQVNICELGEGMTMSGMQRYWMVPDALGLMSDGGTRVQCMNVEYGTDAEGNEEVTLFIFKCYNGMAVYKLSLTDGSDLFVLDGIRYRKTGSRQVQIERLLDNKSVVEIPETVTYKGANYQVTSIENGAFEGYSLDLLVLPSTISSIDPYAFTDCTIQSLSIAGIGAWQCGSIVTTVKSLYISSGVTSICGLGINANEVFSYATTPPVCDEHTFTDYGATLHVPATSVAAYFVAPYWCNFGHIVGDSVEPLGVALNKDSFELSVNEQLYLTATVTPANATPNTVMWGTTDASVATVDNGLVSAVSLGECDIVATCGGQQAVCHVIVVPEKIIITLDRHTAKVLPNHMVTLVPSVTPVSTELAVTSSEPAIAAVRIVDGIVQVVGITEGTVAITVGSVDGNAIADTCQVMVYTEHGDVNCDGYVTISDMTKLIDYLLIGTPEGLSVDNADTNKDGKVSISDVTTLIDFLLSGRWPWHHDSNDYVDLGLPSGTLWATCNVGANYPEDYGNYFAWGETEPKEVYSWETYKWCNGSNNTVTKYCVDSYYGNNGFTDGKTELDSEDDAAYVNWGPSWRMPSYDQLNELKTKCTWTWTTRNNVKGRLVTGPNGNSLFLPASGYRWYDSLDYASTDGYYWSRTLYSDNTYSAVGLCFHSGEVAWTYSGRKFGLAVRAVRVSQN